MSDLTGKAILVTGGASGIGRAAAALFAARGAHVMVADIDAEGACDVAEAADGRAVALDLADEASVIAAIEATLAAFGRIDAAFNNAGIQGPVGFTADCAVDDFDRVVAINLRGTFLCLKHQIAAMLAQSGEAAIVNTSSVMGLKGGTHVPAYIATKHAIVGLSRAAALEYADRGIRVNALCPGVVDTPFLLQATGGDEAIKAMLVAQEPVGRGATPEEIAEAAAWLLSDAAGFVTGSAMVVDGGMSAR